MNEIDYAVARIDGKYFVMWLWKGIVRMEWQEELVTGYPMGLLRDIAEPVVASET
jgi:hypothetical protein